MGISDVMGALNAVSARYNTLVGTGLNVPTQHDNAPFDPPDDEVWVRFSVLNGESNQVSFGGFAKRHRTTGLAIASVYCPMGLGDDPGMQIANFIALQFRAVSADFIHYRSPSIVSMGQDKSWWRIDVSIPYYYDLLQ